MTDEGAPLSRRVGAVAIGRNEGHRLHRCLESARRHLDHVVYVDSGSTDGSLGIARSLGVAVVELDLSTPFTAARARNAGLERLRVSAPDCAYVQFVDGDCELVEGWLETAAEFLDSHGEHVAVHGRRRERFPEASPYNRLTDMEWDVVPGDVASFGGDVLVRIAPLLAVGGYREDLIAGEEPELCIRLRARRWRIQAMDVEMTLHDAALSRFGQWWQRAVRAGYAYANRAVLHGRRPERPGVRESVRVWVWGPGPVLLAVFSTAAWGPMGLTVLGVYPLQWLRLYLTGRGDRRERMLRASALVVCKFAEWVGQVRFLRDRLGQRRAELIEYK